MRIAYVGHLWNGSTSTARANVLSERGHEILPFDMTPYLTTGSRVGRAIAHRLLVGPAVRRLNDELCRFLREIGRADVIWFDKARWVKPETLHCAKKYTDARLVHYTPDPAFFLHKSRYFGRCIPLFDLCVTTKRYELLRYREHGAREVIFTWQGIDDRFVGNPQAAKLEGHRSGVVFVGHREPHYARLLRTLARSRIDLRVRGPGWDSSIRIPGELRRSITGAPVWGTEYVDVLALGNIGLGLLSKYCPDQFTTRSFEIPGAGAMLLAERTSEHLEIFEEGKEADFFSSAAELLDKTRFYLTRHKRRTAVAAAGRLKVLRNYHWRDVLRPALGFIEKKSAS
jgi:hypothetical protein